MRLIRIVCAAIVCLALCHAAFAESSDPVVVRVGDFTYPRSVVQGSLDSVLELSEMLRGDAPGEAEKAARLQSTIDTFVNLGVIENRLAEAGRDGFTEAERETMHEAARSKYEELWQLLYQQMQKNDAAVTDEAVTEQLEGMGYTFDAICDELELQARQNRAIELFVGDIVLKQSQVDAYYEEQFVAPDRAAYENDIDKYDQEILMNDSEAFFTPEGYHYIRQIVLEIPEDALKAVKTEQIVMNRAAQSMANALQRLTLAATEAYGWTDALAGAKARYDEAADALKRAQADYQNALAAAALPRVKDTTEEIRRAHAAGIDFKSLIDRYSADRTDRNRNGDGYPFHPDSRMWPDNFKNAAAALKEPGDISEPFVTEQGVHILYYAGDAPAGAHALTDDERAMLNAAAYRYYRMEALNDLVEGWKADYAIETHPELLKY